MLIALVVLPTPPLWFSKLITVAIYMEWALVDREGKTLKSCCSKIREKCGNGFRTLCPFAQN
jgi:hypothetical protein